MQRVEMNAINIQIISFKENNFIIGTSIYVHKGDLSSYIYIYIVCVRIYIYEHTRWQNVLGQKIVLNTQPESAVSDYIEGKRFFIPDWDVYTTP